MSVHNRSILTISSPHIALFSFRQPVGSLFIFPIIYIHIIFLASSRLFLPEKRKRKKRRRSKSQTEYQNDTRAKNGIAETWDAAGRYLYQRMISKSETCLVLYTIRLYRLCESKSLALHSVRRPIAFAPFFSLESKSALSLCICHTIPLRDSSIDLLFSTSNRRAEEVHLS